jgi:hypothetical protein
MIQKSVSAPTFILNYQYQKNPNVNLIAVLKLRKYHWWDRDPHVGGGGDTHWNDHRRLSCDAYPYHKESTFHHLRWQLSENLKKNTPPLTLLLPTSGLRPLFLGRALSALRSIAFLNQNSVPSDLIARPGSPNNVVVRPGARANILFNLCVKMRSIIILGKKIPLY